MRPAWVTLLLFSALPPIAPAQPVNADALILQDFSRRVADYGNLHKRIRSEVQRLKPTNSPAAIELHEHRFAHHLRQARRGVVKGNIFTPEIAAEFRRLIAITMQGPEARRIHESLSRAEPVHLPALRVNATYPERVPLQSTPPSLLLNLPALPPELEYRVVGHSLVLRDVEANVIVDFMTDAIH